MKTLSSRACCLSFAGRFVLGVLACWLALGAARLPAADASVADLIRQLKSSDESARLAAIDGLGAQGEQAATAVTPLTALLKDSSAKVRLHAVHALGAIGAPAKPAIPAMAELLKDPDDAVRRQLIKAIRAINPGPQVMVPLCVKMLQDSDTAVRVRILNTIAAAGKQALPGLIEALKNEKAAYWACVVLRSIGPDAQEAVPALVEKLRDPQAEVRREAILALGAIGEGAIPAIPQIAGALADPQTAVAATFVLGQLGQMPSSAEATVLANTKSPNRMLSTISIWSIARIHPDDKNLTRHALEHLVERIKDEDQFIREMSARALLALPPAPELAVPIWEKAFKNMDEKTARNALDALASLGPIAVPRLIEALRFPSLREEVASVLGRIGPPAAAAAPALTQLITDKDPHVVHAAVLALANIGPAAKDAVPALIKGLEQQGDANSDAADFVFALGSIGPDAAKAAPRLLPLLDGSDRNLALISAWSLSRMEPTAPNTAAKTVPVLISGLSATTPAARQAAAEALGGLGPLAKSALPALAKASADDNQAVRDAATKALAAIRRQ